jgi:hypothetical protein
VKDAVLAADVHGPPGDGWLSAGRAQIKSPSFCPR